MTIQENQAEIVEEFSMFDDWMQRYEYMIELGKSLPKIEDQYKTDDHLIKGCQSKVWVHADLEDGKVLFTADSDAIITKGIIGILIRAFSHQKPQDIIDAAYQSARQLLADHRAELEAMARLLLEKEKIDAQDIRSVLGPVAPSVKATENVSTTRNVA